MTRRMYKGVVIAALHLTIVMSLGAKFLVDRATRPRVWARAAPVDPNLPIRGRYVRLRVEAAAGPDLTASVPLGPGIPNFNIQTVQVDLTDRDGRLAAVPAATPRGLRARVIERAGERFVVLDEPLAFFIPEHAIDPSRRLPGEELWVEVTIPRRGAPRPIRLGVKKDGALTPLQVD